MPTTTHSAPGGANETARAERVAALFIDPRGPYANRHDVDAWDEARDARNYNGPWPVVAHPPCQRWGRYWSGGPNPRAKRLKLGEDGGCFVEALSAVRTFGGVLEHPEASHAFDRFCLQRPNRNGGWHPGDDFHFLNIGALKSWVCCVEQGHYGHPARKATWLYYVGYRKPPDLIWGPSNGRRLDEGFHSKAERDAARAVGRAPIKRLSTRENLLTPPAFAELLISLARQSRGLAGVA